MTEVDRRPVHTVNDNRPGAEHRPRSVHPGDQGTEDEKPRVGERKRSARAWDMDPPQTLVRPNLAGPRDDRQAIAVVQQPPDQLAEHELHSADASYVMRDDGDVPAHGHPAARHRPGGTRGPR